MTDHFRLVPDGLEVTFDEDEARLLADLPGVLARLGDPADDPGAARLNPPVYLGDPDADAEWRRLAGTELGAARRADRSAFELIIENVQAQLAEGEHEGQDEGEEASEPEPLLISTGEAEAMMRVINEVRLVLGARWQIDGPEDYDKLRPEASDVLSYLGWLVTELAEVLGAGLDGR